ncbi:hypothetical protein TNCV_2143971 [Trichonephila clavipes]|nr:hypothetical protein TNCV_2143971 [Trichonephila clavipes]
MTQITKSLGKPWATLSTVASIPRHLERAKGTVRFWLTIGHDFLGVYLHWRDLVDNQRSPICGHATDFTALDSMNTRLTTSLGGTGWLGVKWSRS